MKNYIETPKMSEILSEEFMSPLGLSAYRLAQEIHVPVSRIQDDIDIRNTKIQLMEEINSISTFEHVQMG